MAKIKDVFEEVFVGVNLSTCSNTKEKKDVYTFKKDNILYGSILYNNFGYSKFKNREQYKQLSTNDLLKIKVPNIKDKYYLRYGDIIISLKKPYRVFNNIITSSDNIIVTNNYIILRKIDSEKYYAPYIAYFIENIGILEMLIETDKRNTELSLENIRNIELPNISKKEQIDKYIEIKVLIKRILQSENRIKEILSDDK